MSRYNSLLLISLSFLFLISSSYADDKSLIEAFKQFKMGSFTGTLEALEKFKTKNPKLLATKKYLEGLSHNRLQDYDLAAEALTEAGKADHDAEDLYYELGQALYADNQLARARAAFIKSHENGYMVSSSLYYMGHISQILYENDKAIVYYDEILRDEKKDIRIRQIARFQRAESMLLMAEDRPGVEIKKLAEETILPQLRRSLDEDKDSSVVADIQRRILEIQTKFGLDPNRMINGRTISTKKMNLFVSQKLRTDDNITLANDQPTVATTKQSSLISDTTASGSYSWSFKRKYAVTPEIRFQNVHHFERNIPAVFTNDRYTITPTLRTRYEHTMFGKMTSTLFNIGYDYAAQDKLAIQEKSFFSRSLTYTLGQRIRLISYGDTTFRFRIKKYDAHSDNLSNDTTGFSIDQIAVLPNSHLMIFNFSFDSVDNYNNPIASTASMTLRTDYVMSNIFPQWNLDLSLSYNALDTKEQSDVRGTEVTLSPAVKLTRRVFNKYRLIFEYAYNTKSSDSPDSEYQKNLMTFELRYDF